MIPEFLKEQLTSYYNPNDLNKILEGYNTKRPVTLRVNNLKSSLEEVTAILDNNHLKYHHLSWYPNALVLPDTNENTIENLNIYQEGKIYLQSLSSMLPPLFLEAKDNELILDMAAAPGGKTTEIAALTNNKAMITAIEKNKIRAERLKYNLELQGTKKVSVITTDARHLDEYFMFDKILLDAPCSGSGTLNINDSFNNFTLDLINRSSNTQKVLLEEALKHLKVGGTLIYSTCSILKSENEEVLNYILNKYPNIKIEPLDITKYQDLPYLPSNLNGVITISPSSLYEGFFISKLIKK